MLFTSYRFLIILRSFYKDEAEDINDFTEECEVDQAFSDHSYQPTPDGTFVFTLIDIDGMLDLEILKKIEVEIDGTWIPF